MFTVDEGMWVGGGALKSTGLGHRLTGGWARRGGAVVDCLQIEQQMQNGAAFLRARLSRTPEWVPSRGSLVVVQRKLGELERQER